MQEEEEIRKGRLLIALDDSDVEGSIKQMRAEVAQRPGERKHSSEKACGRFITG
jgi:multidrug resistance efflux pump